MTLLAFAPPLDAARRRAVAPAPSAPPQLTYAFDFANGALGWEADFSDYSRLTTGLALAADVRLLPAEIGSTTAFYLAGMNRSDDLFMFLRRRLTTADGILPGRSYVATFRITLATNAGPGCVGIGGSPGESVYLKAGIAPEKPAPVVDGDNVGLNVDKSNQSQSGLHASVAGNVGADLPMSCGDDAPFVTIRRPHTHPHAVAASPAGELWLLVGTDSRSPDATTGGSFRSIRLPSRA